MSAAQSTSMLQATTLPAEAGADIILTCRELKTYGWSDAEIEILNELIGEES